MRSTIPSRLTRVPSADPPLNLSAADVALLTHLCDLLCFFITHHTFRSKYLILSSPDLAKAVSRILRPRPRLTRHTHLRLAALRFLRACVARNDDFYNRFLVKHDLIRPVLDTADEEKSKDNLLGSACLDFFEYLRTVRASFSSFTLDTQLTAPRIAAVQRQGAPQPPHGPRRRRRAATRSRRRHGRTAANVRIAHRTVGDEQRAAASDARAGCGGRGRGIGWWSERRGNVEVRVRCPSVSQRLTDASEGLGSSMQRQTSLPGWTPRRELEEESYFNTSDDEDDSTDPPASVPAQTAALLASASFGSSRRKREPTSNPAAPGDAGSPKRAKLDDETPLTHEKLPLVDYADDDDDNEDVEMKTEPAPGGATRVEQESKTGGDDDAGLPAGGFIRERRGALDVGPVAETAKPDPNSAPTTAEASSSNGSAASALAPADDKDAAPFLPSLGALKRKKEDDDDDGELGLLAKRRSPFGGDGAGGDKTPSKEGKPAAVASAASEAKPGGFSISLKGGAAKSPPSASTTASTPKPGGFKIALGGLKSKFTGASSTSEGGAAGAGTKQEGPPRDSKG